MAIIADNTNEDIDNLILSDDGSGGGLRIPSVMIRQGDGESIKRSLRRDSGKIELQFDFDMRDHQDESGVVNIDIWYTSSDHKSLRLVEHVSKYVKHIDSSVMRINPRIVSMRCGDDCSDKYKKDHCLSKGKYCDLHADTDGRYGASYMLENLFQYCL